MQTGSTARSLGLRALVLLGFAVVASEPERDEEEERGACAERARVVWPRGAQETRVLVVPRRHDRYDRRARQVCPPTQYMH